MTGVAAAGRQLSSCPCPCISRSHWPSPFATSSHPLILFLPSLPLPSPLPFSATAGTNKGHVGTDHAHLAKLDRENEVAPPPKVAPTVGKAISQARQDKGLNQKDLGTKINEKPQVIAEYESGKAIPNPQILSKMERALGLKLRGKDIGQPLSGPSKKK
ncbi:hypothetical protein BCV69DRAFT_280367 [Microstroma glucosiphilum]|uniref:HTH cro/C1-type domain-containing protein n=1 Tax=Pseudomicrostroma glucosiphilum TaxID=1684307 RepID=A0A316UC01_9BASI|nr:hypothetical protein BCV69DRAFT_280367 [Pseudomicrostroma glucosiphilum]PWN22757.1 hypothetical protein BCV69DRAFT_280367 [Pseudomicrostroma glucosiphilum]